MSDESELETLTRANGRLRVWAIVATVMVLLTGTCLVGSVAFAAVFVVNNPLLVGYRPVGTIVPTPYYPQAQPPYPTAAPYYSGPTSTPIPPYPNPTPRSYPAYPLTVIPSIGLEVPLGPSVKVADIFSGTGALTLQPSEFRMFHFEMNGLAWADVVREAKVYLAVSPSLTATQVALYLTAPYDIDWSAFTSNRERTRSRRLPKCSCRPMMCTASSLTSAQTRWRLRTCV